MQLPRRRCFPGGIAVMLLDEGSNIWKSVMLHRIGQIPGPAIEQYMLMHLVITRENAVVDFDLFISTQPMPEQSEIPTQKIAAMVYPAAQKPESAVQIKSVHVRAENRLSDFAF